MEVVPAIIPKSVADIEHDAARVRGLVRRVQVDVMDGRFAPEPSWPYNDADQDEWRALIEEQSGLPYWKELDYEIDMMVEQPERHLEEWVATGATALIVHFESTQKLGESIDVLRGYGVEIGLASKPATSAEELEPWIPHVDFVQCMGNDKIGFHGVELDAKRVLGKVRRLREAHSGLIISVDIGVNTETAPALVEAGVSKLVSGSAIFGSSDIKRTISGFQNLT